jgi:hypothetical protein
VFCNHHVGQGEARRRGIEPPPAPGREKLPPGIGLNVDELGLISLEKLCAPVPTVEDAA